MRHLCGQGWYLQSEECSVNHHIENLLYGGHFQDIVHSIALNKQARHLFSNIFQISIGGTVNTHINMFSFKGGDGEQ